MRYYVLLLIIAMYVSITLLEALIIVGIIYIFFDFLKKRKFQSGKLGLPILLYALPTILSTFIFYISRFNKAIEEGLFQFIYFLHISKKDSLFLLQRIAYLFVFGFFFLLPFELFSFYKYNQPKPVWGGAFETGFFFTLFGLTFLLLSFIQKGILRTLFLLGGVASFILVILSHKRSMILAFVVLLFFIIYILYKNKFIKKPVFLGILVLFLSIGLLGYVYLSKTDNRFKTFNELILGKRDLNEETFNIILSGRYALFKEGVEVIKRDISERNFLPLLIGHGTRAKEYLTHKSPITQPRYESFFIFSEFIERGFIGVIGILMIYFIYFKEILTFSIKQELDVYRLVIMLPLGIHLIQTLFTYFWDAMLPVFLLLFKIYEISKESES